MLVRSPIWLLLGLFAFWLLGSTIEASQIMHRHHVGSRPVVVLPRSQPIINRGPLPAHRHIMLQSSIENTIDLAENETRSENLLGASNGMNQTNFLESRTSDIDDASTNNNDTSITTKAPDTRTILKFAIPAIGIWLCSPLMSIIDTASVGIISGTAQQAALNPAIAVTDYSACCMSFLYTGTTNLVAVAQEADKDRMDEHSETKKTLKTALRLSSRVGLGFSIFIITLSNMMLKLLIGNNSVGSEVMGAAQKYVWVRALSMPAAAMIGSAQAACLAMQDVKSPLLITLVAAVINLVGDLVLVPHKNPWVGGAAGAAWGTTISQYAAMVIYIHWLTRKPQRITKEQLETANPPPPTEILVERSPKKERNLDLFHVFNYIKARVYRRFKIVRPQQTSLATRGCLHGSFGWKDIFRRRDDAYRAYSPFVVPVTSTQIGRCSVYIAMGHVVSSTLGTLSMAAHQIVTVFFYALIPMADSLSQTAQAMLPRVFAAKDLEANPGEKVRVVRSSLKSFLKAALLAGFFQSSIVACIPLITKLFMTSDPAVLAIVNTVVPIYLLIFSLHGIFCASEGILMAQKDLGYLGSMYSLYFVVIPTIMLQLKRQGSSLQLKSVWMVFLGYQLFRISAWVARVMLLFSRTQREASSKELSPY